MTRAIVRIDGREVPAERGQPLLWAALDAGIAIPNLCATRGEPPDGSCRLCFVEVEGRAAPVPSCAAAAADGMVVRTQTPAVAALRRTAFELLMAAHARSCKGCAALRTCELIRIARREKWPLRSKRFPARASAGATDARHAAIVLAPDKCVWCGRCIVECRRVRPQDPLLQFARRGARVVLSTFHGDALPESCAECLRCVDVCPAAGLSRPRGRSGSPAR